MILYIETIFLYLLNSKRHLIPINKASVISKTKVSSFLSNMQTKIARNSLRFVCYQSISGKSLASILGVMLCPGPSAQ